MSLQASTWAEKAPWGPGTGRRNHSSLCGLGESAPRSETWSQAGGGSDRKTFGQEASPLRPHQEQPTEKGCQLTVPPGLATASCPLVPDVSDTASVGALLLCVPLRFLAEGNAFICHYGNLQHSGLQALRTSKGMS